MTRPDGHILVTGAGGYLGGRVATALGDRARALTRRSVPWLDDRVQVEGDLLDPSSVTDAFDGTSAIIHLAGHNEVIARTDPERAEAETVAITDAVVDAARRHGVGRIVYVSTIHVYGEHLVPGALIGETTPAAPTSAYARARAESEQRLDDATDLDVVVFRLSNAVGAPAHPTVDRWTLVASELCRDAVLEKTMTLRSAGLQTRDFITVRAAVDAVTAGTDRERVPAGAYNLASGVSLSIRDLAHRIGARVEERCGWAPTLEAPEPDGPAPQPYDFDVARLAGVGLAADESVTAGIDELIDHCRTYAELLGGPRPNE